MDRETLQRRKVELVERHGPWTADSIELGHGVWTMEPGAAGLAEARVARITQIASDLSGGLDGVRVLDLGCYEGGFSVSFAKRGAHVLALEGRPGHVAKARFAKEALALDHLEVVHADIRELDAARHGTFDVVLCLGVLYHLDAPEVFEFAERLAACTRRLAIVETQVALHRRRRERFRGEEYWGSSYEEDVRQPGASLDNRRSLWLTLPSLLNLLAACGFTSVSRALSPAITPLDAYEDHAVLIAAKGEALVRGPATRWPERLQRTAHPSQGPRERLREAIQRRRGGGLPQVFRKHGR